MQEKNTVNRVKEIIKPFRALEKRFAYSMDVQTPDLLAKSTVKLITLRGIKGIVRLLIGVQLQNFRK